MRIRLAVTLSIERRRPVEEEPHETFESQGALVEQIGQPRHVGFSPALTAES